MRVHFFVIIAAIVGIWAIASGCAGDNDSDDEDTGDDTSDDDATDDDATTDDDADDDVADDDASTTTTTVVTTTSTTTTTISDLVSEDFESYSVGQSPTGPWNIFEYGANNMEIVDGISKAGEGQFLKYAAGIGASDYGNAAMEILVGEDATFSFDIYRTAGASTHFMMTMNDGTWLEEVILDVEGATGKLRASTPTDGDVECADLPDDEWIGIAVDFLFADGQFDVLVNDVVTDCVDFDALHNAQQPFRLLQWMDYDDPGYGGTYFIDNIRVQAHR